MSHHPSVSMHGPAHLIFILVLSGLLAVSWFVLTGDVGLSLMDEGYLWYDTHRIVLGDVPIRDFRSYDPGRYYWGAGWALLLGDGIRSLRISIAVVQFLGLIVGLLIASRVTTTNRGLVAVGILLLLWMYPRYKLFEHTLEICALFLAIRLIEQPHQLRYFHAGLIVGLAAFFGQHLGFLFVSGFSCLIVFLELRQGIRKTAARYGIWMAGVTVGYLPMILMLLCVPNFAASFADSIARLTGPRITEPFLSIPFVWKFSLSQIGSLADAEKPVLGTILMLAVVFYLKALSTVFRLRDKPPRCASVLTASVFLGIPLLFYFLIRADFEHFALSSPPLLFGLLGLLAVATTSSLESATVHRDRKHDPQSLCKRQGERGEGLCHIDRAENRLAPREWLQTPCTAFFASLMLVCLALIAVFFSSEVSLTLEKLSAKVLGKSNVVTYRVLGDTVWIPRSLAQYLNLVKQLIVDRVGQNQGILIAPYQPGLYRILQTESPIWDAYPIHLASPAEEQRAIEDLQAKNIQWALISNGLMDEMPQRCFSRTHPKIWKYLNEYFVPVYVPWMPDNEQLLCRSVAEVATKHPESFDDGSLSEELATLAKRRGHKDRAAWQALQSIYENPQKMDWISRRAEGGDPLAQFHMGLAHQTGAGVFKNFLEAATWYRKSADQGYAVAETSLGFMYVMGAGVAQDYAEAVKWYRKGADQGEPVAQACLGNMYEKGEGVPMDLEEAEKWYRKAADQGYLPAKQALERLSTAGK
jgi:TPR repeat protein